MIIQNVLRRVFDKAATRPGYRGKIWGTGMITNAIVACEPTFTPYLYMNVLGHLLKTYSLIRDLAVAYEVLDDTLDSMKQADLRELVQQESCYVTSPENAPSIIPKDLFHFYALFDQRHVMPFALSLQFANMFLECTKQTAEAVLDTNILRGRTRAYQSNHMLAGLFGTYGSCLVVPALQKKLDKPCTLDSVRTALPSIFSQAHVGQYVDDILDWAEDLQTEGATGVLSTNTVLATGATYGVDLHDLSKFLEANPDATIVPRATLPILLQKAINDTVESGLSVNIRVENLYARTLGACYLRKAREGPYVTQNNPNVQKKHEAEHRGHERAKQRFPTPKSHPA